MDSAKEGPYRKPRTWCEHECQWRFVNCTNVPSGGNADGGGGCVCSVVGQKVYGGVSVHSPEFPYEPTTALKIRSFKEWTDGHNASVSRSPVICVLC